MKQCVYILFLFSIIIGCKKHPEDRTLLHLRRAEKRLKSGTDWKITEYKVNEVDSLPYINSLNPWGVKVEDIKFERLGKVVVFIFTLQVLQFIMNFLQTRKVFL